MKLKSFFAGSVEAALGMAREELGSEAVLVNSRKAPPEAKHLGEYEVVAAWLPGSLPVGSAPPARTQPDADKQPLPGVSDERLCQEVAEIRRQMERMRRAVWRTSLTQRPAAAAAPGRAEVLAALAEADVDPQLAQEIAACVGARLVGDPLLEDGGAVGGETPGIGAERLALRRHLKAELARRFSVDSSLGKPDTATQVVALVGPPGAGKTTTLAKLAVLGGLGRRRRTQILSLDNFRVGSGEPLRTYAALLGVGLQPLGSARGLRQALEELRQKELILIDTPGYGPKDMDAAAELAQALAGQAEIDTHLILPATMRSADLTSAVDRFEVFRPSKLLFTRVDETSSLGPAFSEAARTAKPLSFLAAGQQVPEDIEEAAKQRVVELVLERLAE